LSKRLPIFYSALLLTGANLLLRFAGTSFQVYLSGRVGASGIGLLQLIMSVGSLAMIAGIAGIRTGTMYLTAEELGRDRKHNVPWILSACFLYSIVCSGTVSGFLFIFAPFIAEHLIGNQDTIHALRLFAAFLPVCCLCSVMTGYFTAANRIGTLTVVEITEQLVSMAVTMGCLILWAEKDAVKACLSIIFGSCIGSLMTLNCLIFLHVRDKFLPGESIRIRRRLVHTAAPLAVADILRSGISTAENLMVPKRLSLNLSISDPLAAFGTVSGMIFPVLMFPACILFSLAELLIPELARCNAANSRCRISYLVKRGLKFAMLYGLLFSGFLFLFAEELCFRLYQNADAAQSLRMYSLMIPMLYCDAITDAMIKGLGQQKICVRYNILTSAMDVLMLYFLLPVHGMAGYYFSFLISHLVNFLLSLRLLLKITGKQISLYIPMLAVSAAYLSAVSVKSMGVWGRLICYPAMLLSLLYLLRIFRAGDYLWLANIAIAKHRKKPAA